VETAAKVVRPSFRVQVADIHPDPGQPRKRVKEAGIDAIAHSFERVGQLEPVLLRRRDEGGWWMVAGERRWRAASKLGWTEISAIETLADPIEVALVENLQREDLTPFEEADGIHRLMEEGGYTQEQASDIIGRGQSDISRYLRLRTLPDQIRTDYDTGMLDVPRSTLLELARLDDPELQLGLWEQAKTRGLTVREARAAKREPGPSKELVSEAGVISRLASGAKRLEKSLDQLLPRRAELQPAQIDALRRLRAKLDDLIGDNGGV
jgi:ParB family chromosome partitioning protein